ncbi:MAG: carnitine dehydratase [Symbiobacteriaceae bacterium]|jgi:formyl-CoA transferase|nr:carnitine dehydratase [Symbiobacteriaceae bacterium]
MIKHPPLTGLTVLELGQFVAGPFCTRLLAEFGATVIKLEQPGTGDPLRTWRLMAGGTSLWWYVQARNKKSVTLDLRTEAGQELARELAGHADIVVENFRPGTLEGWGLGWERLHALYPHLIMVRISGYGQDGPDREKPGFGNVGEAVGGLRYVTGFPDRPPVRSGVSLGDTLAGLYGALGAVMAAYNRDASGSRRGQMIDVALYEAVFSIMESLIPEYDRFGYVRERTGNRLPGVSPSSTYACGDGQYVAIGANGDSIFRRFMAAIGRGDLGEDPRFRSNEGRAAHADLLEHAIEQWAASRASDEVLAVCEEAGTPAGRIYTAADMVNDPQYLAREMIRTVMLPDGPVRMPGVVPKLSETPGDIRWPGPALGEHTEEVLREMLGLSGEQIAALRARKVV